MQQPLQKVQIKDLTGVDYVFNIREKSWDINVVNAVVGKDEYLVQDSKFEKVLDIGGHIGTFAVMMAKHGSEVYTFEPLRANFDLLLQNIEENGVSELVHPVNAAIHANNGTKKLIVDKRNYGATHFADDNFESRKRPVAKLVRLRDVMRELEYVDLLKMDCEGAEYLFMEILRRTLFRVGSVRMELHPHKRQKEFIDMLALHFQKVYIQPSNAKKCLLVYAT